MSRPISRFNPQRMTEEEILSLSTGRDNLLKLMMDDMQVCLHPNSNQHFIFYGPRGIGKSFFTRLLKISHDRSSQFNKSLFIQLPEEQSNISYVADLMDMISTKLEGKLFDSMSNRWDINETEWQNSKKRLKKSLEEIKKKDKVEHVFFTMENLQDFIPKLSSQENGRMREFLSEFSSLTLIGSSLHPDIDNDYSKKLFQVFKKIDLKPWGEKDYITYYRKKAEFKGIKPLDEEKTKLSEHRIRAIANFTGGSPRLAVILNSLILNDDILSTLEIMNGIIDELTPYYQDLTKDIPPRSKILFDSLIRMGENITQSQLAAGLQPPQEQKTIAKSFSWLTDNFYVNAIKQKTGNVKHYYVRDRLYVLYYQNREIMADQKYSFVETFVEFLTDFYNQQELKDHLQKIDDNHFLSKELLFAYIKKIGVDLDEECTIIQLKEAIANFDNEEIDLTYIKELVENKKYDEALKEINNINSMFDELEVGEYYDLLVGNLNIKVGNYTKAINHLTKAMKTNPKNASIYNSFGDLYSEMENYDLALKSYNKSIKLGAKSSSLFSKLGDVYKNRMNNNLAINYHLKSLEIDPKKTYSLKRIGLIFHENKDYKKSIKSTLDAIKLDPTDDVLYILLAMNYYECKEFKKTEESLLKVLEINPKEINTCIMIAKNYYSNLNDYEKAEKYFLEGFKIDSKNETLLLNIIIFYFLNDNFSKIENILSNSINTPENGNIIANALSVTLKEKNTENFHRTMKVLTWLENDHKDWLLPFTSGLTSALYIKKDYELLSDFIEELKPRSKSNNSLQILIQAWQYILAPEKGDLAALHPDARIAVQAVLENKN